MSEKQPTATKPSSRWLYLPAVFVLVGAVAFTMFYGKGNSFQLFPDDPTIVAQGQSIYQANCASCHGVNLEGQPNWQKRTAEGLLPAPPHDQSGHTWHHASELLFKMTKFGPASLIKEANYKSGMPDFAETLSDKEVIAVLSFIKNSWPADVRKSHNKIDQAYKQNNGG